ncbi:hypothetical protein WN48_00192 [Eufriesea mexicana]|nr:hypothetical protein WN48_00192 [Eufriesea mexicana]
MEISESESQETSNRLIPIARYDACYNDAQTWIHLEKLFKRKSDSGSSSSIGNLLRDAEENGQSRGSRLFEMKKQSLSAGEIPSSLTPMTNTKLITRPLTFPSRRLNGAPATWKLCEIYRVSLNLPCDRMMYYLYAERDQNVNKIKDDFQWDNDDGGKAKEQNRGFWRFGNGT